MKLISMTDFVLEQNKKLKNAPDAYDQYCRFIDYARFLKEPLSLEMFVPCLDVTPFNDFQLDILNSKDEVPELREAYQKAKEKVLFEGFEVTQGISRHLLNLVFNSAFVCTYNSDSKVFLRKGGSIESLLHLNITLNPSAIKQLGL